MDNPERHLNNDSEPGAELDSPEPTAAETTPVYEVVASIEQAAEADIARQTQQLHRVWRSFETPIEAMTNPSDTTDPDALLGQLETELTTADLTLNDLERVVSAANQAKTQLAIWLEAAKDEQNNRHSQIGELSFEVSRLTLETEAQDQLPSWRRLLQGRKRATLTGKLQLTSDQLDTLEQTYTSESDRIMRVESGLAGIDRRQQELANQATERLFQAVLDKQQRLLEELTTPTIIADLNDDLIARLVIPKLTQLQTAGVISDAEAADYLTSLPELLSKATYGAEEDQELVRKQRERLDALDYNLRALNANINLDSGQSANTYYERIMEFILQTRSQAEITRLQSQLSDDLDPEQQSKISTVARQVESSIDQGQPLAERVIKLDGLERWATIKPLVIAAGLVDEESFNRLELNIIQTLCEEKLYPGGRESDDGTTVAYQIGKLGNPAAIPFFLHHIEVSGTGHTNNIVAQKLERLLKESDPASLDQALAILPPNKQQLLQLLLDENSYLNRFGRANYSYNICTLLQAGDLTLAREKLTAMLEDSGAVSEEQVRYYYLGLISVTPEMLTSLLAHSDEITQIMISSKLNIWSQSADKLLAAMVNPKNGDATALPKRIASEGLGVSGETELANLDGLLNSKIVTNSGFERETITDGLLLLNSKPDGQAVLETLLQAYRGAKDDPRRVRRILQLMMVLEGLDEYSFHGAATDEINQVQAELEERQSQRDQASDKNERKKLANQVDTLTVRLQNLTGLKGIEEAMTQQIATVVCRRLELPPEYLQKINDNLEQLLRSGLIEIVSSLAGHYNNIGLDKVRQLLMTITRHIVDGDFSPWRYTHEQSENQLAGLNQEQREFWQNNLDPITLTTELSETESERRLTELKAAQAIIANVKEHILMAKPLFDFSPTRATSLAMQVQQATENIKTATIADEKEALIRQKRALAAELTVIRGITEIERADAASFSREQLITQTQVLHDRLRELDFNLAVLDIEQVAKIFTVGEISGVIAYESDDPLTLLKVGTEPQETCQSWRQGSFNECLLAYVADSNKKVINITDSEGRIVARSVIKLTNQRELNDFESKTQQETILVERPYSILPKAEVYRAFFQLLLTKATGLNATITLGGSFGEEEDLRLASEEAAAFGYQLRQAKIEVFIPPSMNQYEYSDLLGGRLSTFNHYQPLDAVILEKTPA